MKGLIYRMFAPLHLRQSVDELRKVEGRLGTPRNRFAVPFAFRGDGMFKSIRPRQNTMEIQALYDRVCELMPRRVLEIGTANGGTLYLWTQAAAEDATIVSVDLPGGKFGGGYPPPRGRFYQHFARPEQDLHLLRLDSHLPSTLRQVREVFGGEPVDFAFIDGDHTYAGVKADFIEYGPLVRPGGLIAFHDVLLSPRDPSKHVHVLWDQLKGRHETWEFVDHASDRKGHRVIGIGLLRVGPEGIKTDGLT